MKEVAFLKKNADKWKRLELLLDTPRKGSPDLLAELFLEITDDLSFARTQYPNSKTTQYLNLLASRLHQRIYRNKKEETYRFLTFWSRELPLEIARSHHYLLYSLIFFSLAVSIGVISTLNDDLFVRMILGDRYVNITEANINSGEPLAVYKSVRQLPMFLGITFNNIRVAFLCFASGILFSLGTVLLLLYNGVMLGTFHTFFYQKALLGESLLTVWIHGTLEISAIIIAGCAGLVMGNSLLFPGTYTRMQSLLTGARRGLKIAIGLVPIFVVAGFLESFVTRYTQMPFVLNGIIIGGSALFMIWYFLIYPIRVSHKEPFANDGTHRIPQGAEF